MGINAIFLDVDGVLNNHTSKSRCGKFLGIDKDKVKRLSKIVKETQSILILTSSWKVGWDPKDEYIYDPLAKYLNSHLKRKGRLVLTDKTKERNLSCRGMGIKAYLILHPEITNWIVLDDEIFPDYQERKIMPHLIKTNPVYGLTNKDVEKAIKMLNI